MDEPFGIGKAFFVEFPFAQPVGLEPAGIQMDDITGVMFGTHPVAYLIYFISAEVGHAAHPDAETPEGGHGRISGQIPITPEDFFHRVACYDENIQHGLVAQELYRAGGLPGQ